MQKCIAAAPRRAAVSGVLKEAFGRAVIRMGSPSYPVYCKPMPGRDHDRESPITAAPPLIDVQAARVQFGALVAVHDVSLSLRAGDLVRLVCPNGAGQA